MLLLETSAWPGTVSAVITLRAGQSGKRLTDRGRSSILFQSQMEEVMGFARIESTATVEASALLASSAIRTVDFILGCCGASWVLG